MFSLDARAFLQPTSTLGPKHTLGPVTAVESGPELQLFTLSFCQTVFKYFTGRKFVKFRQFLNLEKTQENKISSSVFRIYRLNFATYSLIIKVAELIAEL